MGKELVRIGVELDRESDGALVSWAKTHEQSKRRFARLIVRRAVRLWKQNPDDEALKRLGLISHGLDR